MDNEMQQILDLQKQGIGRKKITNMIGGKAIFNKTLNRNNYIVNDEGKIVVKGEPIQEVVTEVVMPSYKPIQNEHKPTFTRDEVDILLKLVQEYKVKEGIRSNSQEEYDGTLKNRNVRVYEDHYNNFSSWCKDNNITQATALRNAIDLLMNSFK